MTRIKTVGIRSKFYADIMGVHSEVTGSSILSCITYPLGPKERILIDCGLFQEKPYLEYNKSFPWDPETIDCAILTHIHIDHLGRFPLLVKNGYRGKIYMSEDSKTLVALALYDSCKILNQFAKKNNEKPLYTEKDVKKTLDLCVFIPYRTTINITDNVKLTFFENGHVVGSVVSLLQIDCKGRKELGAEYGDINLIFTGDYNDHNDFFDVSKLPEWVLEPDLPKILIQEATYGDKNSYEIEEVFERNITTTDAKTIVLPVFSLGRSQEILFKLRQMQKEGKISTDIPIYFDGKLAFRYTDRYLGGKLGINMFDFLPENLIRVSDETRPFIMKDTNPKIIVSSSGMGSYGPSHSYILEYIARKDALIHFTGYCAEGTLGRKLKDAEIGKELEVSGLMLCKRAQVEYTAEFSAHAKADQMIDFIKQFKNLRFVIINHGSAEAKDVFSKRLLNELKLKSVGVLSRDYFFRVGPYGLIKSMTTKFS